MERRLDQDYFQTGKIRFTYRYFPVVDQGAIGESHWAAAAAECANEQGKFWDYHDKLFSVWQGENLGTFSKANLKKYAADLKLDTAKFNPCVDSDKYMSLVQSEESGASAIGVRGTPTFLINGRALQVTTMDYASFARTFDTLLK